MTRDFSKKFPTSISKNGHKKKVRQGVIREVFAENLVTKQELYRFRYDNGLSLEDAALISQSVGKSGIRILEVNTTHHLAQQFFAIGKYIITVFRPMVNSRNNKTQSSTKKIMRKLLKY